MPSSVDNKPGTSGTCALHSVGPRAFDAKTTKECVHLSEMFGDTESDIERNTESDTEYINSDENDTPPPDSTDPPSEPANPDIQ